MPDAPKQPVTVLGDLRVDMSPPGHGTIATRYATVADLKSACRALDWLVIEKVDGEWPTKAQRIIVETVSEGDDEPYLVAMLAVGILDALAEAQPFPPAGG